MAGRGQWRTTVEDVWNFDLSGFVHCPAALDPDEIEAARQSDGDLAHLQDHPTLKAQLRLLCGESAPLYGHAQAEEPLSFRLDRPACLVPRSDDFRRSEYDSPHDRLRLRYDNTARSDQVVVKGVRALWVLDDTDEVVVVPATHKADLPAPPLARAEAMDTVVRPALQAGDLLLLAGTTLFGLCPPPGGAQTAPVEAPRVAELLLADAQLAASGTGYVPKPLTELPPFMAKLSEEQRAVLLPGAAGHQGQALATDGNRTWLEPGLEQREISFATDVNAEELWQWTTQGYVVARGVMDAEWLEAANEALDTFRTDPSVVREIGDSELWQEPDCSSTLRPTGYETGDYQNEERMSGLEGLPEPHCQPFLKMIAHPAVVERLNWMLGPGWHEGTGSASVNREGAGGQQIHGGPFYGRAHGYHFDVGAGRPQSIQVNYAWCLRDVDPGAGGFCLVPGSFKMRHPIPRPPTLSIDLPAVKHLTQKAGDIVFYHGGSTVHGVMGWRAPAERRAVLKSAGPASYPPGGGHAPRL